MIENKDFIKSMIKDMTGFKNEKDKLKCRLNDIIQYERQFSNYLYEYFKDKFDTDDEHFYAEYCNGKVWIDYYIVSQTIDGEPKSRYMFDVVKLKDIINVKDSKELIESLKEFDCHYGEEES